MSTTRKGSSDDRWATDEQQEMLIVTGMSGSRPIHGRQRARGPRLVRRRQPSAADAAPARRARRARRRPRCLASPRSSTSAAATSSPSSSDIIQALRAGVNVRVVFLDANDAVLVRRFESVRRPHPLQGDGTLLDGIAAERARLAELREASDIVIDTSDLNIHQLATLITETFAEAGPRRAARHGAELRVQVRAADRRRPGRRRAIPAEPVLGARAAARSPARTRRSATTCSTSPGRASSSTPTRAALEPGARRVPAREQAARYDRHRMHRRQAPLGRARARARRRGSRSMPGVAVSVKHRDLGRE